MIPILRGFRLALVLGAALAAHDARAQSLPVARANAFGGYDFWSASASGPATQVASFAVFLPVELAGASFRDRLRCDRPIGAGQGSPAPHIRLPGGGSLFLTFATQGATLHHVDGSGVLHAALVGQNIAPSSPGGGLLSQVAVSPDGRRALAASTTDNEGEVVLLDLASGGAPAVLTAALPPLIVAGASLRVSSRRAFFVASGKLYRADLTAAGAAGQAALVPLGLPDTHVVLPELLLSADGGSLALVSEAPGGLRQVHVVRPDGSVQLASDAPAPIDAPALQSPLGPLLAISADGAVVAWRASVAGSHEVFLQAVPPAPLSPPVQLTAVASFADTLDDAGLLGFAPGGLLTFVVGQAQAGALGGADLFTAELVPGGAALHNATATSGLTAPPFLVPGELSIAAAVLDPLGERLLLTLDPAQGGDAALLAIPADGSGAGSLPLPPFAQPPVLARAGHDVLLQSVPASAPAGGTELHLLAPLGAPGPAALPIGTAPPGVLLDRITDAANGSRVALVAHGAAPAVQLPLTIDIASGAVLPAWTQLFQVSPLLALPPSGALVAGVGNPGGPYLFIAFTGFNAGTVLKLPAGFGFPLPF